MIYTKRELDVEEIVDKTYLNKLIAIGEELNRHYQSREGIMDFSVEGTAEKYKKYDAERKEIEERGNQIYKEYVKHIQNTLKPEGMSEAQAEAIWQYAEFINIGYELQEVVESFKDICQLTQIK